VSGCTEVFVISPTLRDELVAADPRSSEIIRPFAQGTHLRPWYIEDSNEYLIFSRRGIAIDEYPTVLSYLERHRMRLEPRPNDWPTGRHWQGRKPGGYEWYEIQDTIDYWQEFNRPKIVWPDISKLPRFSMDFAGRYLGNTAFIIPGEDYFLLGVMNSWATWFFISKTAQPLRLRGDRWQYRLFAQYMQHVPIPDAGEGDRQAIAELARSCGQQATERYELQSKVQRRLLQAFGQDAAGAALGQLNQKAQQWWTLSLNELGQALKTSFKLRTSPFKDPRLADQWEPYLAENREAVDRLTRALADAEADLNDRVYALFHLTPKKSNSSNARSNIDAPRGKVVAVNERNQTTETRFPRSRSGASGRQAIRCRATEVFPRWQSPGRIRLFRAIRRSTRTIPTSPAFRPPRWHP
jgi:hypothetical protein